jgi:hypothetical protein
VRAVVTSQGRILPPGLREQLTDLASFVPDLFDVADRADRGRLLLRIGIGACRAVDLTADDAHHVALLRAAHGALIEAARHVDPATYEQAQRLHYLGLTLEQVAHLTRDLDSARKAVAAMEAAAAHPIVQDLERRQMVDFSSAISEASWFLRDLEELQRTDFDELSRELAGIWALPSPPEPDFDRLARLMCGALDVVSLEAWLDEMLGVGRRRTLWEQVSIILTGDVVESAPAAVGREPLLTSRALRALPDQSSGASSGTVEIVIADPANPNGGGFVAVRFYPRGEGAVRLVLEAFEDGQEVPGWIVQVTLAGRLDIWRVTTDDVGEAILENLPLREVARGAIVVVEPPDVERSWYLLRGSLIRMLDWTSWSATASDAATPSPRLSVIDAQGAPVAEVEISSVTLDARQLLSVLARVEDAPALAGRTVALDLAPDVTATGQIDGDTLRLEQTLDADAVASALAAVPADDERPLLPNEPAGTSESHPGTRELRIPPLTTLRLLPDAESVTVQC